MSSSSYEFKEENNQNQNPQSKPLFNSKLFLNLDINQEEINDLNNIKDTKEDLDYSNEFEQMNYLSHELIKDLNDSMNNEEIKEKNIYENIDKKNKRRNIQKN